MKSNFTLIEKLNTPDIIKEDKNPYMHGITYDTYEILVNGKQEEVLIPLKESDNFEKSLMNVNSLDENDLRKLLREHRGIRKS